MNARLVPVYFEPGRDSGFDEQLETLKRLLADKAEFLAPVALGSPLPEADAVVLPQLVGEAYRRGSDFRAINMPILVITSPFGTFSMWDWEIISYLKAEGIEVLAPYTLSQTLKLCNAMAVRRRLRSTTFLVYQDDPGNGAQAAIFKRFYWWEDECLERMQQHFGISVVRRSFRDLGERAKAIPDAEAEEAARARGIKAEGLSSRAITGAVKLYLALNRDLDQDNSIGAVGINCLNESHFSDTTPCMALTMLFEDRRIMWGCEADLVSMLTEYLLYHTLELPVMMTNLYPFLMGEAALKHERIVEFPTVAGDPADYLLVAHCGYLGLIPRSFATEWTLRKRVLAIVNENSTVVDGRLPLGPVSIVKLQPTCKSLTVAEGELVRYVQYPGSDCLNGGVIRVANGHRIMRSLPSHHAVVVTGHHSPVLTLISKVFDLSVSEI